MTIRGNLYKPKGRRCWYYRFEHKGRPYHGSTGIEVRAQAEKWLRDFRDNLAQGTVDSRGNSLVPTLLEALERIEADQTTGHSESTTKNRRTDVMAHMQAIHHKPIDQITTQDVRDIMNGYLAKKNQTGRYNTPGGANHIMRSLGGIMKWAEEGEIIERRAYKARAIKQQNKPKLSLEIDELRPFLEAVGKVAPNDARDLIILEMGMGLRESEARHALIEHTNMARLEHTVYHPEVDTKGKEAEKVPIPKWTVPHLERMIGGRKAGLLVPGDGANGAHGRNYTLQYVKMAAAMIGKPGLTPHNLRNTYATLLSGQGEDPKAIQKAMRHKHLKTTLIYITFGKGDVREGADKIGEAAGLVSHRTDTIPEHPPQTVQ